jgi:hypothetical protein
MAHPYRPKDKERGGIQRLAHRDYMRMYMREYRMGGSLAMFRKWKGCFGYGYYLDEYGNRCESPRIAYVRKYMREYMKKYRGKKGYLAGSDRSRYNARMRKYMKEYRKRKIE